MITQDELRKLLHYDPSTGLFTWIKQTSNRVKVGDVAGSLSDTGYIDIRLNGKLLRAHRLAWLYTHGAWPTCVIDHINHNRTDNRLSNLRDVPISVNASNVSDRSSSASGYTGVTWCKSSKKWRVKIQVNGRHYHIGRFEKLSEAVQAYSSAKAAVIKIKSDMLMNGDQVREQVFYKKVAA
ncbi:HNH endonuclease [Klebsiella pneumoniae]|nr:MULTISPECIES: HNH endonuclease [Klebsiella]EGT0068296.1 HNH endonuclease [Klebsiella michiganensis]ELN0130404.1 HNH endonuclease [Raoultella planticola]TWY89906.1 HNH endonuclease [Klebsiella pneumoniae]WDI67833.1 HNH endonuclease [Klebsiella grimontii]